VKRLLVLLVLGACATEPGRGDRPLALWSEFLSDDEVRASLPLLAAEQVDLYLAVKPPRVGDPALAALIRDADAAGVGVRAWILLDEEDGYWPGESNPAAAREAFLAFADWRDREALPVDWVIFDMEMDLARTRRAAEIAAADGAVAAMDYIKLGRSPAQFAAARVTYAALLAELKARGLRVMCITYPTILDDPTDGDDDIQDQLDVPVLGLDWDEASFMVYQSVIFDLTGDWYSADVVASYAASAELLFPGRSAVALGIIGSAGIVPVPMPYPDAATLLADHAAARAAGAHRVSLYSLDGILAQDDPGSWIDARIVPVMPPPADADYLRRLIRALMD
jgi:hypothetical protein